MTQKVVILSRCAPHFILNLSCANAGIYVHKYVDRKGSAATLTIKKQQVLHLRKSLHIGNEVHNGEFHSGFETQGRRQEKS